MGSYGRIRRGRMAGDSFTQIRNDLFRDPRISAKAKGIFGLISTHRNGYGVTPDLICDCMTDGLSAIRAGLRELEGVGYLRRIRERNENGTLGASIYYITDEPEQSPRSEPDSDYPPVDKPHVDEPHVDDRTYKNTSLKNTSLKNTSSTAPPADAVDPADDGTLPLDITPPAPTATDYVQRGVAIYVETVTNDGGIVPTAVRAAVGASIKRLLRDPAVENDLIPDAIRRAAVARHRAVEQFLGAPRATQRQREQQEREAAWDAWARDGQAFLDAHGARTIADLI